MCLARIAFAAMIGLAVAIPVCTPSFAEEARGGAEANTAKTPRKKERDTSQTPSAPSTKPDGKIIFF